MPPPVRYEILTHLPPYGPAYVAVPANSEAEYSEGFAVRFYKEDGSDWVANFKNGWGRLSTVIEMPGHLLVVAHGMCYVMGFNSTKPENRFGGCYDSYLQLHNNHVLLYGNYQIVVVNPDITYDEIPLYFEEIKNVTSEGSIIKGSTCDYTDVWVAFEYNFDTRKLITSDNNKTIEVKPWWKFW